MIDAEWRITYWNATAARLLDFPRDQALGRILGDVVPTLSETSADAHLRQAMQARAPVEFLIAHPPDPYDGYYSVRAAPLDDGGLAVHFRDATDELELSERYSRLLESMRDGFVAVGTDGDIIYMNRVAERLLRLPRTAALGASVWPLIPAEPAAIASALRDTIRDGKPRTLHAVRPEGAVFRDRFFDLWVHPLPGGGVSALFQDVSERIQRDKDLARYAAEAEEANRAKSRFFAAVSHELRTPLNAIVGYTHLLSTQTYGALSPPAARAAERTSVCAEHLARMVDDVLLMTTAEIDRLPAVRTSVALDTFLPSAIEPLRQQAEAKGLRVVLQVAPDTPVLETDPDRLRQLLAALVSNAVKFTSRGEVRIAAQATGEEGAGAGRDGVRITIQDTGPGIPPDERDRVFEAFEQLGDPARSDSLNRGPGLGLTLARHLTKLLGGTISIGEAEAGGASFSLFLPLRSSGAAS
ncbi:hypothetical protein BH23GEM3_BH23GEM3_06440 [soil metagenome]